MFPFLWTPEGTLWCSTNAPQRVIKVKIDPLFFFNQDLAIYVVRKEDTGIVFFVFPAKSRLPTKTQIIAKNTLFPRCTINTHLCINCASRISLFYLMRHFSISNYPCLSVGHFRRCKALCLWNPNCKAGAITSSYLLIFIQNASFEDRTCVLLDIINTSDGQLFLTRRAPALRARLYITPKSISYTHTHKHTHRST